MVMNIQVDRIQGLADVIAIEKTPFEQAVSTSSTFEMIHSAARQNEDRTAIIFLPTGKLDEDVVRVSYRELITRITQTANMFHRLGIGPSDTVSYLLPNLLETQYVLWGAQATGIVNPINFLLQSDQVAELLNAAEAKVLVALGPHAGSDIWEKVSEIRDKVESLEAIISVGGTPTSAEGVYDFHQLMAGCPGDHLESGRKIKRDDIAAYFHTGGTTGTPKLAMLTHENQVHAGWGAARLFGMTPDDVLAFGLPLFHVGGTITCSLSPLSTGGTIVMLSPAGMRNPLVVENHWKLIEKYRATIFGGVPTALAALVDIPIGDADISSAEFAISGASSLPKAVAQRLELQTQKDIHQILGMTETGGVTAIDPRHSVRHSGSVGIRLPYEQLKTVYSLADGSLGGDCASGEVGVLLVKGPNVFPGYKCSGENNTVFTKDGWFISGDLASIDEEGYVTVVGRAKDVIIRGGHNIDPAVIEEAIEQHPAVQISAAVGLPDSYAGEVPVAYVSLRPDQEVDENELLSFVEERVSERPAMPRHIFIVDKLPMTAVGKVFKPQLRCEAVGKLIEQELLTLKSGKVAIDVRLDSEVGLVAALKVSDHSDFQKVQAEISEKLDGFLFSYVVEER